MTSTDTRTKELEAEVAVLEKALINVRNVVDEQECSSDEDCDHCVIIHQIIDPALFQIRAPLLLEVVRTAEHCIDSAVEYCFPGKAALENALTKWRESK